MSSFKRRGAGQLASPPLITCTETPPPNPEVMDMVESPPNASQALTSLCLMHKEMLVSALPGGIEQSCNSEFDAQVKF